MLSNWMLSKHKPACLDLCSEMNVVGYLFKNNCTQSKCLDNLINSSCPARVYITKTTTNNEQHYYGHNSSCVPSNIVMKENMLTKGYFTSKRYLKVLLLSWPLLSTNYQCHKLSLYCCSKRNPQQWIASCDNLLFCVHLLYSLCHAELLTVIDYN